MKRFFFSFALYACLGRGSVLCATEPSSFQLRAAIQVDGEGVFLNQLVESNTPAPSLRLCDAPAFGKTVLLTRAQIDELVHAAAGDLSDLTLTNWSGAEVVRVVRRCRTLTEPEALHLLTEAIQQQYIKDKGTLELRFLRPWTPLAVPDEPLTLKVVELTTPGVGSAVITRFELATPHGERLGPWQASVQAHVWREIWIARTGLKRDELVRQADVARERRDVLLWRDTLAEFAPEDSSLADDA